MKNETYSVLTKFYIFRADELFFAPDDQIRTLRSFTVANILKKFYLGPIETVALEC